MCGKRRVSSSTIGYAPAAVQAHCKALAEAGAKLDGEGLVSEAVVVQIYVLIFKTADIPRALLKASWRGFYTVLASLALGPMTSCSSSARLSYGTCITPPP